MQYFSQKHVRKNMIKDKATLIEHIILIKPNMWWKIYSEKLSFYIEISWNLV